MSYPPQPPQPPQGQPPQYPPQYQQPYGQQPYGQYQAPVQAKSSTLALVGFFMALACLVLVWIPTISILGWLLNLTAFILCIVANSQIKNSQGRLTGKGFAVAGIVITSILFGIFVLLLILAGALIGSVLGGLGGL